MRKPKPGIVIQMYRTHPSRPTEVPRWYPVWEGTNRFRAVVAMWVCLMARDDLPLRMLR